MNIVPLDIVERLVRAKPFWFNGEPKVKLTGLPKTFGRLIFEFDDDIIHYKIRITDRKIILDVVEDAIRNFKRYVKDLYE